MPTLPRLSSDGRQIKTYAKVHQDKNHPYEVKESSFGITKSAKKLMRAGGVYLVFDIEANALHFATEKECARGTEPDSKKFMQTVMGKQYKEIQTDLPMKNGFLYLKPYFIKFSSGSVPVLKTKGVWFKQGVKDKGDFNKTVEKCRMIWVLCSELDRLHTLEESYPEEYAKLSDEQKTSLKNFVLVDKSNLVPIKEVPYYQESIDYAKSKGIKDAQEEAEG